MKAAAPPKLETQDVTDALCRIEMFGGLCIVRGEEHIDRFARQKAGMLLAYLALSPRPHSRERLLDLFWPEMDLPASRDNLSTALASLRRQIEPPGVRRGSVLSATHTQIGLNTNAVTTDVAQFDSLLAQAALEDVPARRVALRQQAAALYRDGFLPGCYEDWAVREADRLEARLIATLTELAEDQERLGAPADALETARRRTELDLYSEDAHYQLIRLAVEAGQPQAARTALTRFEEAFASEYGAEPSPQTRRRIEQLLVPPFRFASASRPSQKAPAPSPAPPVTKTVAMLPKTGAMLPAAPRQPAAPPVVLSRFFGRESEIRQLIALLLPKNWMKELAKADAGGNADEWEPPCRLVTLTGPGGNGKTRLAIETVRHLGERLSVWCSYVGLAEAAEPDQIHEKIASALGIVPSLDMPLLAQIAAFFAARESFTSGPSVLVLDNLEHLLNDLGLASDPGLERSEKSGGAEAVRQLLESTPSLTLLCTSRRRLGLRGERAFPVDSLPLPSVPESELSANALKTLAESPSVRLYLDRARAVRPDFTLTASNAPAVAALCRQLEGSPLALELAAAWVRTLPPRKMWERLTQRLDIPPGSYSDLPARHRNLTATLEWSWRLLPPAQQQLWAQLSVFRGGWTAAAAETVGSVPNAAVLLADLVEASLITTTETEAGEVRYGFLETVRAFGEVKLQADEEQHRETAQRHAACFGTMAATAEPELRGPAQARWLERLEEDHDNFRAALGWYSAQANRGESGLQLAVTLGRFWNIRGYWKEAQRWLDCFLSRHEAAGLPTDLPPDLHAKALNLSAGFARLRGDLTQAQPLFEESLRLRRQIGDLARVADTLHNLGYLAVAQGDLARAKVLYEESLTLCRQLGDGHGIADELHHLGLVAQEAGETDLARSLYEESVTVRHPLGDKRGLSYTLHNLGNLSHAAGDLRRAEQLHEESLALRRELQDKQGIAASLQSLGMVHLQSGNHSAATTRFRECLPLFTSLGDRQGIAGLLNSLSAQAAAVGDAERCGLLAGAEASLRQALGLPLSAVATKAQEQAQAALRTGPDAALLAASRLRGQAWLWEEAVNYIMTQS